MKKLSIAIASFLFISTLHAQDPVVVYEATKYAYEDVSYDIVTSLKLGDGFTVSSGTIFKASMTQSDLIPLKSGSLTYEPFAMFGQEGVAGKDTNTIPDFSHAGYMGGGVALPDVPVVVTIGPVDGDDTETIQCAIETVEGLPWDETNKYRGAVLLAPGHYQVNGELLISKSGVVLRGSGQGANGTILHADSVYVGDPVDNRNNWNFITIQGGSGVSADGTTQVEISSAYVPVGAMSFEVPAGNVFGVDDTILIVRTPNQKWIDDLGMAQHGWTPDSYTLAHERVVTDKIEGEGGDNDIIIINIPIVDVMENQYDGGVVSKIFEDQDDRIRKCGVENLRIVSTKSSSTDEHHIWTAVYLSGAVNSWVKNVTAQYMARGCVTISGQSNFNTIQDCAAIDHVSKITGSRRYSFEIGSKGGMGNLFQRCYTSEGRHDFVTGARVAGPNVFLDCSSTNTYGDIGPHHRWATGTLFDNIRGGEMRVWNRGNMGSGHGWSGAQTMFWNLLSSEGEEVIKVDSPIGSRNWGIGCVSYSGGFAGDDYWESQNTPVNPRSLYLGQLQDRKGSGAVNNVTIAAQRSGNIYDLLVAWAGEGALVPETPSGTYINPVEDAYIRGDNYKHNNYGNDAQLVVKNASANNTRNSYLKFDLSSITDDLVGAKLMLKVSNDDAGSTTHELFFVSNDTWSESSITSNNSPSLSFTNTYSAVPMIGNWVEFEVGTLAKTQLDGDKLLSVAITETTTNHYFSYHSSEASNPADRPRLVYYTSTNDCNATGGAQIDAGGEETESEETEKEEIVGECGELSTHFEFYPNPVSDQLTLSVICPDTHLRKLTIYNLQGVRVMEINDFSTISNQLTMDISSLTKGLYIISLESDNGMVDHKILIE
ncbi:MAG: DNRLRE domain-containing protein [Cytophagales bacterium]|nr:DNRLRE domain-containing protein [Cytophagales bacterium]